MDTLTKVISSLLWINIVIDIIGLTGNVTTIVVLAHRKIRCSTSVLLIVMGVYDSLFLVTDVSLFVWRNLDYPMDSIPIHSTVIHVAATGSVYTAIVVTVERYVAVRHPFKAMTHCHLFKMWKPAIVVLVLAVGINVPRNMNLHTFRINETTVSLPTLPSDEVIPALGVFWFNETSMANSTVLINDTIMNLHTTDDETKTELQGTVVYVNCYDMSVSTLHRSLHCYLLPCLGILVVPFAIIVLLNILILKTLSLRKQMMTATVTQFADRGNGLTRAAIGITSCFFVFCTFPGIYYIARYVVGHSFGHFDKITESICYTLLLINFSTNFILYCFLGRNFRHILLEVFCSHNTQ